MDGHGEYLPVLDSMCERVDIWQTMTKKYEIPEIHHQVQALIKSWGHFWAKGNDLCTVVCKTSEVEYIK